MPLQNEFIQACSTRVEALFFSLRTTPVELRLLKPEDRLLSLYGNEKEMCLDFPRGMLTWVKKTVVRELMEHPFLTNNPGWSEL